MYALKKYKNISQSKKTLYTVGIIGGIAFSAILYDVWKSIKKWQKNNALCVPKIGYRSRNHLPVILTSKPILVFMFGGAGWLYPFHFGVAKYLQDTLNLTDENIKFIGTSAGGAVASALACNLNILEIYETCQRFIGTMSGIGTLMDYISNIVKLLFYSFHHSTLYQLLVTCFQSVASSNTYFTHIQNRLLLNVTIPIKHSKLCMSSFIKDFPTFEHFLQALCATCYVPIIGGFKWWPYPIKDHSVVSISNTSTSLTTCVPMIDGWFSDEFSDVISQVPEFLNHQPNQHIICYIRCSTPINEIPSVKYIKEPWMIEPEIMIKNIHFIKPSHRHFQALLYTLGYLQAQLFIYQMVKHEWFRTYIHNPAFIPNETDIECIKKGIEKTKIDILQRMDLKEDYSCMTSSVSAKNLS